MSVEKIDFSYVSQEKKTFTTHLNSVLQNLRNPEALGIWSYLSSLPEGWVVNKEHLKKHFKIGRYKIENALKYLSDNKLIEIGQLRLPDGTMGKSHILVRCGYNFNKDIYSSEQSYPQIEPDANFQQPDEEIKNQHSNNKNYDTNSINTGIPTGCRLTARGSTARGETATINNIKSINKEKREREPLSNFEPNEENQLLAKDLKLKIEDELESFTNRHKGEKTQYEFGRWLKNSHQYLNKKSIPVSNETRSTVPEYGPGHPRWEQLHGSKTNGSEISGNNSGRDNMRKVEGYIF